MPAPRTDIRSSDDSGISDQRADPHTLANKLSSAMVKGRFEWGKAPKGWDQSIGVGSGGGGGSSGSRAKAYPTRALAASIVKKRTQKTKIAKAING
jgi:hypothetical protein